MRGLFIRTQASGDHGCAKAVAVSLASGQILDISESIANGIHCWIGCGCKRKKEAIDDFNLF